MGWPLGLAVMLGFWGLLAWLGVGPANTSGNLTCSGDSPPATNDGHPNTVTGTRSGECGPGF